jgi:hypothetical protein
MAVQLTLPALKALIPNLLKTGGTAAATNAILSSLFGQGGAVRSPVPTAAAGKYTLPQNPPSDTFIRLQKYNVLAPFFGLPTVNPVEFQEYVNNVNRRNLQELGERERALEAIKMETAALPAAYQAMGTQATATSDALQSAIDKILYRPDLTQDVVQQELGRIQ